MWRTGAADRPLGQDTASAGGGESFESRVKPSPKSRIRPSASSALRQLDNPALQRDRHGMRAIVCAQFGENVGDVGLDGRLADRELISNVLVGIAGRD